MSFDTIRQCVERSYEEEYRDVVESGIYRDPLNYYLVCSYPVKPSGHVCDDPSEMFKGFNGEIALYFHIPFCATRCTFCNFHFHTGAEMKRAEESTLAERYVDALGSESDMVLRSLLEGGSKFEIHSVYVGGGTPTYLEEQQLKRLIQDVIQGKFQAYFRKGGLVEFTVESSPGTVTEKKLNLLKNLGVTRLSIGVQTFDDYTLRLMNRDHDSTKAREAIRMAKEVFGDRFNVDIIPGFPVDTSGKGPQSAFQRLYNDLMTVRELELPSVTFYHLWTRGMDTTAMMKNVQQGKWLLPSQEEVVKCWLLINQMLNKEFDSSNPYHQNPAGWFIRSDSALFKQQIFKWSEKHQYLGIGVSAYDYFNGYATRSKNGNNIQGTLDYIERVSNGQYGYEEVRKMKDDEIDRLKAVFAIKTRDGLDLSKLLDGNKFNIEIGVLAELDLVKVNGTRVQLTNKGFVFFDEVSEFFFKSEERTKIGRHSEIDVYSMSRNRLNYFIRKTVKEGESELEKCKSSELRERFDKFLQEKLYNAVQKPFDFFLRSEIGDKYKRALFVYLYGESGKQPVLLTPYHTQSAHVYKEVLLPWFQDKVRNGEAISLTEVIFSRPDEDTMYFPPPISFSLEKPSSTCSAVKVIPVDEVQKEILRVSGGTGSVSAHFQGLEPSGELTKDFLDTLLVSLSKSCSSGRAIETVKTGLISILASKYSSKADSLRTTDPNKLWPSFIAFLGNDDEKTKHYLYIPLDLNERCLPVGVVLELSDMVDDEQYHRVFNFLVSTLPILSKFQERIRANIKHRESIGHALRSAVVAIMARNLSHNIGSHILARLSLKDLVRTAAFNKNFLNSVQLVCEQLEQLEGDAFGQPSDIPLDVVERMRSLVKGIEPNIAPIVAEVANLNALLRTRMDFVADIATAHKPPPALGISFVSEVLIPLTKQVLFWDNLCASHGLNHEHIIFRFKVDNESDDITLEAGKVPELKGKSEPLTLATAGFPNGIIGCQAFYCIVENFLRNAVKHSPSQSMSQQSLELTLWLQQAGKWKENEHLMKLVIYDNWHACQHKKGLVNDINKRLKERVIRRDDGSLIASNRGLKEMKAAAAYLRGYSPEAVEDSTIKPPLLTAVNVEGSLGYELFVLRPKELLVAATADKIPRDKHDLLRKQGVEVVSDASTLLVKARDYPLLLVMSNDDDIRQALGDPSNVSDLPLRIIIHNGSEATAKSGLWQSTISYSVVEETFNKILESLRNGQGTEGIAHAWELWTTLAYKVCTPKLWVKEEGFTQWNINDISRLVQGDAEPDQGTQVVLYARHGYPDRLNASVLFYEPYGKGVDPISFVMENPPNREDVRRGLAYQLIDVGLTPILILDERVQEMAYSLRLDFSEDPEKGPKELAFWLRLMRVYVPPKNSLDLESKQLTEKGIKDWVTQKVQELSGGKFLPVPPVLVIHQGILDVIGFQDSTQSQQWIDTLRSSTNNGVCDVVITSGRGVPDNVPQQTRFLPLSTLLLYTVERKSKFHLVRSLLTARRVLK